ncbi:MAG: hypothetical protein EWM51_03600 [Treponema sp.]|nr:MAG: hypothetical protein EWM51_03600 [Treponema sp.]
MNKMHTPEPWKVEEVGDRRSFLTIAREHESILTVVEECGHSFGAVYNPDDALRIVACVNACRGIEQEVLADPEYSINGELESIDDLANELSKFKICLLALEEIATAVDADIDAGRPLEYNVAELRTELIRARKALGILPEQEQTNTLGLEESEIIREEAIESKR